MNKTEAIKSHFSKRAEEDMEDVIPYDERVVSYAIILFGVLIVVYFVAHQMWSTGFFTPTFGTLEMIMLYGSLIYWIVTSALLLFVRKNLSRDLDVFGGLIFATVGTAWLLVVFPFEFTYFADVLPDFLRFLAQWISNDIARVVMVLGIIGYLGAAVYAPIAYGFVGKKRSKREE